MSDHQFGLWILNPASYSNFRQSGVGAPSDRTLLLRQAAAEIVKLMDLPLCGELNLEAEPKGPAIILTLLPGNIVPLHPAADELIQSAGVRLLLSRPSFTVLFVYPLSRTALNHALNSWISLSPHQRISCDPKYQHLATRLPLSWSFVTVEEILEADNSTKDRLDALRLSARFSSYDPTGLRSFVHLAVSSLYFDDDAEAMPPRPALVVDDEKEPCERFAYLVRRLGFSPLLVGNGQLWSSIRETDLSGEQPFELAVVDNFLGFDDRPLPIGHDWLRGSSIRHKWFKSAHSDSEGVRITTEKEYLVRSRPSDAHELVEDYLLRSLNGSQLRPLLDNPFFDFSTHEADRSRDSHFHEVLIQIGLSLVDTGARLEKEDQARQAALHYLDAFLLLRGRDGTAAATAFSRLQEIEIEELLDDSPRNLLKRWPIRQKEIRAGLSQAFAGGGGDQDREWWTAKTYQVIARAARARGLPSSVLENIERATREVRAEDLRKNKRTTRWIALSLWNLFARYFNSFWRVAIAWLIMVIAFAIVYSVWGVHLGPSREWPIMAKAALASFAGGLGLMYPEAFGLGLPKLLHVVFGLIQRVMSLLLFARMVSLFVSGVRDGI